MEDGINKLMYIQMVVDINHHIIIEAIIPQDASVQYNIDQYKEFAEKNATLLAIDQEALLIVVTQHNTTLAIKIIINVIMVITGTASTQSTEEVVYMTKSTQNVTMHQDVIQFILDQFVIKLLIDQDVTELVTINVTMSVDYYDYSYN